MFKKFLGDETGAISVDFVVLSSAIILMCFGLIALLQTGNLSLGGKLSAKVSSTTVGDN